MSKKVEYEKPGERYGIVEATLEFIKRDIHEIKESMKELKKTYVTQDEFEPVKKIVYGLVALILTSVIGGLLAIIIQGGS